MITSANRSEILSTSELELFRDTVRKFLAEHAPEGAVRRWKAAGVIDRELWYRAAEAGLLGLSVPEEYGGAGADFSFEVALYEELTAHGLDAFGVQLHNGIVIPYIVEFGTEDQRRRWLPRMISGELVSAIAISEPGAGSDMRGIRTTAKRDGDDYLITGQKTFITNGQTANLIAIVAKTGEPDNAKPSIIFAEVDGREGFKRGRNLEKMGQPAADTSELFFDEMRVPAENILGGVAGVGLNQLMAKLPQERLIISVQAVVAIERAIALTVQYARDREAFGKKILDFQNTQFTLAECKTEARIARVFVDHCISLHMNNSLDSVTASMAKYWITELQCKVIDQCVQLHGGNGYMSEYPISEMYTDARVQRIYGGTTEIMKMLIARSL